MMQETTSSHNASNNSANVDDTANNAAAQNPQPNQAAQPDQSTPFSQAAQSKPHSSPQDLNFKPISSASKRLIIDAQKGNPEAINKIIELHYKDILYFAQKKVGPRDGEDVAQQAIIRIGNKIDTLRDPEKFKSWMMSTVFNECNEYLRSKKRRANIVQEVEIGNEALLVSDGQSTDDLLISKDTKTQLAALIDDLPQNYADAIRLRYYEELSYEEIAEVLKVDNKKVKNDLNRALRLLEDRIKRKGGEDKLFTLAPAALVPAIEQALQAEQSQLVSAGMIAHGIAQAQAQFSASGGASLAASIGTQATMSVGKIVAIASASVATLAAVSIGAINLSNPAPDALQEPDPVMAQQAQQTPPASEAAIEHESPIKNVSDMLGPDQAALLGIFENQGLSSSEWLAFIAHIGAKSEGAASDSEYSYSFYVLVKQDKQLLLIARQDMQGTHVDVRTTFGTIKEIPYFMGMVNLFET